MTENVPPVPHPQQVSTTRELHGRSDRDPFAWMLDPQGTELRAHLQEENAYTEARLAPLEELRQQLAAELARLDPGELPALPVLLDGWWYITRFATSPDGREQPYLTRVRDRGDLPRDANGLPLLEPGRKTEGEQVLLGSRHGPTALGEFIASPGQDLLARAIDDAGDGRATLEVIDVTTMKVVDAAVTDAGVGFAFSRDQEWLFYNRVNESGRQFEVRRHRIGTPAEQDQVVLGTPDELTAVATQLSRDASTLLIRTYSRTIAGVWLLDLADPLSPPQQVLRRGDDVVAEHAGDRLLVIHQDEAGRDALSEVALDACPEAGATPSADAPPAGTPSADAASDSPPPSTLPQDWTPVLRAGETEQFLAVEAFAGFAALTLRTDGRFAVRVIPRAADGSFTGSAAVDLGSGSDIETVQLDANPDWNQRSVRYRYGSTTNPTAIAAYEVATGEVAVLFQPQLEGYDPSRYVEQRIWADAPDGTRIPISLISHRDVTPDGTNPGYLYGYGTYGVTVDMRFQSVSVPALDRGVVIAVPHVRGGGEMGRPWQEQAMRLEKKTSFTDFLACADHLFATGWVAPDRLTAGGDGAGGLLVGASMNMAPDRFRAVAVRVPAVDLLSTLLNPETMLTVDQWAEWGDPVGDAEAFRYISSYSPYENIQAAPYPAVFVRTSVLNDRVPFQEAARWVARLRETVTSDPVERPILLHCALDQSGDTACRRDQLHGINEIAWLLDQVGATARI